jgi:hypothetical protein
MSMAARDDMQEGRRPGQQIAYGLYRCMVRNLPLLLHALDTGWVSSATAPPVSIAAASHGCRVQSETLGDTVPSACGWAACHLEVRYLWRSPTQPSSGTTSTRAQPERYHAVSYNQVVYNEFIYKLRQLSAMPQKEQSCHASQYSTRSGDVRM